MAKRRGSPVGVEVVFADTQRHNGQRVLIPSPGRPHLHVLEDVTTIRPHEDHVDAKAVGSSSPAVPQDVVRRLHGRGAQQRPAKEMRRWPRGEGYCQEHTLSPLIYAVLLISSRDKNVRKIMSA